MTVLDAVLEGEAVCDGVAVTLGVTLEVGVGVSDEVADAVTVGVGLGESDVEVVAVAVLVFETVALGLDAALCESVALALKDALELGVTVAVGDVVGVGVVEFEAATPDAEAEPVTEGDGVAELAEPVGVALAFVRPDEDGDGVMLGVGDSVVEAFNDAATEVVGETLDVADAAAVAAAVAVADATVHWLPVGATPASELAARKGPKLGDMKSTAPAAVPLRTTMVHCPVKTPAAPVPSATVVVEPPPGAATMALP